jgi:hypothetical protein
MTSLRSLPRLQALHLAGLDFSTRELSDLAKNPPRLDRIEMSPLDSPRP